METPHGERARIVETVTKTKDGRVCEIPDGRALASCARGIAGTDVQIAGWRLGRRSVQALYYESFGIPGT